MFSRHRVFWPSTCHKFELTFSIDTTIFACIYFCLCSSVKPSALRVLDLNICTYIRKHDGKGFPSWFYGLVVFVLILISWSSLGSWMCGLLQIWYWDTFKCLSSTTVWSMHFYLIDQWVRQSNVWGLIVWGVNQTKGRIPPLANRLLMWVKVMLRKKTFSTISIWGFSSQNHAQHTHIEIEPFSSYLIFSLKLLKYCYHLKVSTSRSFLFRNQEGFFSWDLLMPLSTLSTTDLVFFVVLNFSGCMNSWQGVNRLAHAYNKGFCKVLFKLFIFMA